MIAGIQKLYAGSDEVVKVYAGSDVVYSKGGGDQTIELIIQSNAYVRAYIQVYPWLYQRIYEWPNLLFSLATDKPYMSTLENGGTGYFMLPLRTSATNIDITFLYKAVSRKYARIYGSRTSNSSGDDIWTFINENQQIYNRLGSYNNNSATLTAGNNYIIRLTKTWSSNTAGSVTTTVNGTTYSGSGSRAVYNVSLEPQILFGWKSSSTSIVLNDVPNVLYVSKLIYADTYEYVPFGSSLLDIRNNTVLTPITDGFTWHLFSTTLKTEISNPDISMLLS